MTIILHITERNFFNRVHLFIKVGVNSIYVNLNPIDYVLNVLIKGNFMRNVIRCLEVCYIEFKNIEKTHNRENFSDILLLYGCLPLYKLNIKDIILHISL